MRLILRIQLGVALVGLLGTFGWANSSTWTGALTSDFNTGGNWMGGVPTDIAFFGAAGPTTPAFSADTTLKGLDFTPGASAYTLSVPGAFQFRLNGGGIQNDSGQIQSIQNQSWVILGSTATLADTAFLNNGSGVARLFFTQDSKAGTATITNSHGYIEFDGGSTADHVHIVNSGVNSMLFTDTSTAGSSIITNDGGSTEFTSSSTAGQSVITNSNGGSVSFIDYTTAGQATIIVNAGSDMDISGLSSSGLTAGSIAGAGVFALGAKSLTVGSTNLDTSVSGVISGTGGSLIKVGTGVLSLSGINTYSGGTVINRGTLSIADNRNLGSTAGSLTFSNGATLLTRAGITSSRAITLGAGGGTIDTHGFDSSFSGVIGGAGGFTKTGAGTLTLSAASLYTGATTVDAGVLNLTGSLQSNATVGAAATLSGAGSLQSVTNLGAVTPGVNGNGQLTVASYSGPGSLTIHFDGAAHSRLNVTGAADVTGGTFNLAGSNFSSGQYSVLSAGSLTGTFSIVNLPLSSAFLTFDSLYTPTDFEIIINALHFATAAQTGNQQRVAAALDSAQPMATGQLATVLTDLIQLSGPQARAIFEQIGGDSLASFQSVGLHGAGVFNQQMNERAASPDFASASSRILPMQVAYAGDLTNTDLLDAGEKKDPPPAESSSPAESSYGLWSRGLGFKDNTDANATLGSPGSRATTGGFQVGYDIPLDEHILVGLSGGYAKTSLTIDDRLSSGDTTLVQSGVYASYRPGGWFVNGSLAYTTASNEMTRPINFPGFSEQAAANFQSRIYSSHLETGYTFKPVNEFSLEPSVSLQQSHFHQDGFTETGAPGLDLSVGEQTVNSLMSSMGGRLSRSFLAQTKHPILIGASAAWQHELGDTNNSVTADFAEASGNPFTVQGTPRDRNATALGLDLRLALTSAIELFGNYSTTFSSEQTTQGVLGGFRVRW